MHPQHPGRIESDEHVFTLRFDFFDTLAGQLRNFASIV
jgi:hypothetical protein